MKTDLLQRITIEPGKCGGDRMALLSRGMVGKVTDRIDRLLRGAAGDQGAPPVQRGQVTRAQCRQDLLEDLVRLGHAPAADAEGFGLDIPLNG